MESGRTRGIVHGEGDDDELLRWFDEFHDKVKARIQDNPTELRPALARYIDQGYQLLTDAGLSSALHCFGRYSGLAAVFRKFQGMARLKHIGVQPTATTRR